MDPEAHSGTGEEVSQAWLTALRAQGAAGWNPIRFAFIEALARRTLAHHGNTRRQLNTRLAEALQGYESGWQRAQVHADEVLSATVSQFPQARAELKRLQAAGDVAGLQRLAHRLSHPSRPSPLSDLLHLPVPSSSQTAPGPGAPFVELSTSQYFRSTWLRLSMDQRLNRSALKVPPQAGPLNSQVLALRSLQVMRELSPAYLQCFMAYLDTLLWLDHADAGGAPQPAKATVRGDGECQPKALKNKGNASRRKAG